MHICVCLWRIIPKQELVDIPGQVLYAARVALAAVEVVVQRVAAAALLPRAERRAAVLARVARDVEALVERDDADRLLRTALRYDRFAASRAAWRISGIQRDL